MKGTEKQIKWAEDIKRNLISNIEHQVESNEGNLPNPTMAQLYRIMGKAVENIFANIDDAAVIINKRHIFDIDAVNSNVRRAETLIRRGQLTVEAFAKANRVEI